MPGEWSKLNEQNTHTTHAHTHTHTHTHTHIYTHTQTRTHALTYISLDESQYKSILAFHLKIVSFLHGKPEFKTDQCLLFSLPFRPIFLFTPFFFPQHLPSFFPSYLIASNHQHFRPPFSFSLTSSLLPSSHNPFTLPDRLADWPTNSLVDRLLYWLTHIHGHPL